MKNTNWSIKQLFHSRLFSNIFNQFFLFGFSHIIPIVLIPFLLNTIGVSKYGLINFVLAFSFYFQVVNEFGFDLSNVKHVVSNRNNPSELSRILSSVLSCKVIIILFTFIVYISIILAVENFRIHLWLYILSFIRLIGIILSPGWLFRSMEDIKLITRIVLPVKTICILPIFFVVKSEESYIWVMFFYALEAVCSGIIALVVALKHYKLKLRLVSFTDIKFFFIDSIPFFTSTFLMRVYKNSNAVILGFFCGDTAVGIYTTAEKLHNAYSAFISPLLTQVFYPYFMRIKNFVVINKMIVLLCLGNTVLLFILYCSSAYLIPLFIKTESANIISYFNLFLLLLGISVPADLIGFPYLGTMGFVDKVNESTIWSALAYLAGVVVLIVLGIVTIKSLILLLIATSVMCLIIRLLYIYKLHSTVAQ